METNLIRTNGMGVPGDTQWIQARASNKETKQQQQNETSVIACVSPIKKNDPKSKIKVTSKLENPSYWISDDCSWSKEYLGAMEKLMLWK